ncbi:helix-turn-helix domain-containing protein [Parageobacillus thermoglucosidasius]|uniref:Transcriptional regulator n=1 Tax=Parageobacillus thermoglucosidasius TaxID=1426 RepID=A0AAN1D758_PARTM|nr:helix-turn-helix transcriptional regulator [Parageobacillus thermoglucosidasius]ALF10806.1 XRE family transcriptional regulator [Parageobacillus thermoglucosidasius]ANZ30884.1 transcriptional regulator [Parageobacillus thermoglucosidasius]APM81621.1 transcriptional regulator [Parageobacillus thermoglucosidasius]KJX67631.1 XRE family transcriptional regulator [Parageobacillus thermoglucosidasius]RDE22212.1 XRE family transcriptional regulator [Parageobacillus thermoglucosidasius]
MDINKKVGERIREVRKKYNLSMMQLADELGISQPRLSRIENGDQEIPISLIQQFCERFDIPLSSFFRSLEKDEKAGDSLINEQLEQVLASLNDEQKKALYVFITSFQK